MELRWALTTLTEIINSDLIKERFSLLTDAASVVASPQIRNIGTLGGMYLKTFAVGTIVEVFLVGQSGRQPCYADTPQGMNREHALFDTSRCVAAGASDTSSALAVLDVDGY